MTAANNSMAKSQSAVNLSRSTQSLLAMQDEEEKKHSLFQSVFYLSTNMLTLGILALPSAMARVGIVLGTALLAIVGLGTLFQLHLLSYCGIRTPAPATYRSIAAFTLHHGGILADLVVGVKCVAVATSYWVLFGEVVPSIALIWGGGNVAIASNTSSSNSPIRPWVDGFPLAHLTPQQLVLDREFWITLALIPIFPLCFTRHWDRLKFLSFIAMCFLVITIIVYASGGEYILFQPGNFDCALWTPDILSTISLYLFSFAQLPTILHIQHQLSNSNHSKLSILIVSSVFLVLILYETVAILGYGIFGKTADGNVITLFGNGVLINISRFAVVLFILLTIPTHIKEMRDVIERTFHPNQVEVSYTKWYQKLRFVAETVLLVAICYTAATMISGIQSIYAFIGATGSVLLNYILPGLFYYKLKRIEYNASVIEANDNRKRFWTFSVISAVGMIILGCCIMFLFLGLLLGGVSSERDWE